MNYLIKNAVLLPDTKRVDFCIVDNCISKNTEQLEDKDYCILDLEGRLVLKGFADIHVHLDKVLMDDGGKEPSSLEEAIRFMHEYKKSAKQGDIYKRARRMAERCYSHGTRWIRTHVDVDAFWGLKAYEVLKQLQKEFYPKLNIQIVAFPQEGIVGNRENYRLLDQALLNGADLVGGIPAAEEDYKNHIDMIMDLAEKYNVDMDLHVDETDVSNILTVQYLAEVVIGHQWQGRVTAGHLCSLSANVHSKREEILDLISAAGIGMVTLPSTNLYLQGRGDEADFRRGILPVREALMKNINVAAASDNMRDYFNPFGRGNVLDQAYLVANCCYMGTGKALWETFKMVTLYPARIMGVCPWVQEGSEADFIILNAKSVSEAVIERSNLFGYFEQGELKCKRVREGNNIYDI